MATTLRFRF